MLVDCPECQKKISDSAKWCPNCGLPAAGSRSRQKAEQMVEALMSAELIRCKCGHESRAISKKARRSETRIGFCVFVEYKCEKCGNCGSTEITDHWDW